MKTAIIFPGQGSQIVGMGQDLYNNFTIAKDVFAEVDDVMNFKLSDIMFNGPENELTLTCNTQPALMSVSIAIKEVLKKEFDLPITALGNFVAGHSLGEYTALCATESLTLQDCTKILKVRGKAMMEAAKENAGAMAAIIGSSTEVVEDIVNETSSETNCLCVIANDNSNGQIVISGTHEGIDKAINIAQAKNIKKVVKLPVSGAFHSPLMQSAKEKLQEVLSTIDFKTPLLPVISNVEAEPMKASEIKNLLLQQLTGRVRFRESLIYMKNNGTNNFIEVGTGKVLTGLAKRTLEEISTVNLANIEDINNFVKNIKE